MTNDKTHFRLPRRVDSYLATLNRLYEREGETLLREIIVNGVVSIHEEWDYDNLDGGTYGHAITLTVPEDVFLRAMDDISDLQSRIADDINNLDNSRNEYVCRVFIETDPAENDRWREESGVYRPHMAPLSIPADALQRIWGPQHVCVFLSHKASVKVECSELKQELNRCGISAFVAHEDIPPTQEWQREIERALFSMDALVALLTSDFHNSKWTDQEVGVAIGRGVPLIAIRMGLDPYGLMGKGQGLGGCTWSDTNNIALKVFRLLYSRLADKSRLFECALSAYAESDSFADSAWKVEHLLSSFEELTPAQSERVVTAYRTNRQNKNSFKGMGLLQPLLERWTGDDWEVVNNELVPKKKAVREIPF